MSRTRLHEGDFYTFNAILRRIGFRFQKINLQ